MEWEKKFYDIVRETESNLANARLKLRGNGGANPPSSLQYISPTPSLQAAMPSSVPLPSFQLPSSSFVNNNDHINSIRREMGWTTPQPSALAAGALLSSGQTLEVGTLLSKIDSQNLMIERLERLVQTLNQEKEQYRRQIGDLQSEVGSIKHRLGDSKLGDPHLETQVDLMRHEVRSDMQRLQSLVTATSRPAALYSHGLERSFKDMQQTVHDDLTGLRRDLISMTQRVGRLELDVSTHSSGQRDLRVNRDVLGVSMSGPSASMAGSFLASRPPAVSSGMSELRSTVMQLHDKLDRLEGRLAVSRSSPSVQTSFLVDGYKKTSAKAYKHVPKSPTAGFLEDDDDENYSALDNLDLSGDLDLDSVVSDDGEEDLSFDLGEIATSKRALASANNRIASSESLRKKPTYITETVDLDLEAADLISDFDLDNLDLSTDTAASDGVGLDSLDSEASIDLNLSDL